MKTTTRINFKKMLGILMLCFGLSGIANAQCSAGFTYAVGSSGQVSFTNTSVDTASIVYYNWTFGDGSYGYSANPPSHTYAYNGTYYVSLSISSGDSMAGQCSSYFMDTIVISNASTCNLQASYSYTLGSNGQVTFSNTTTGGTSGTYYSWVGISDSVNINPFTYDFIYNGTYTVTLYANNNNGPCSSSYTDTITITNGVTCNNTQVAYSYSIGSNGLVNFTDASTNLPSHPAYNWNFGDGTTDYTASPSHTYQYNGTYNVYLQIYDSLYPSCSSSTYSVVTVSNASTCPLQAVLNYTIGTNGGVTFHVSANNIDSAVHYTLTLGNGDVFDIYDSTGTVYDTYTSNGTYIVTLQANEYSIPCTSLVTDTITITNVTCPAPQISFNMVKDTANAGVWYAVATYTNVTSATWSWGDGTWDTGFSPQHTYAAPGLYQVCVMGWNSCNDSVFVCQNDSLYRVQQSDYMISVQVINQSSGTTGIKQVSSTSTALQVYPNPAKNVITIQTSNKLGVINLYNSIGQLVLQTESKQNAVQIDISQLPAGIYTINALGRYSRLIKE